MSNRVILLLAGVVIAYFAVYFGDGVYAWMVSDFALPRGERGSWIAPVVVLGIALSVVGFFFWGVAMLCTLNSLLQNSPEIVTFYTATGLVCLACVFGIVAGPFTNYGAYPWYWASRWDWLPILALVPTILVARGLFSEAVVARRNRKATKNNNVSPIRRDTA